MNGFDDASVAIHALSDAGTTRFHRITSTVKHRFRRNKPFLALCLGALGIVYGDIGTSPLYALHETFFSVHYPLTRTLENVLGALSLFFWSLGIVVTVKYISFIMKADNHGEGGIFSLLPLIKGSQSQVPTRIKHWITISIMIGAALLFGDGIITPAISVLSAVEGLEVLTPACKNLVVPITIGILTALFALQKKGTHRIGALFGPIMIVWFICLIGLALPQIWRHPEVFKAINPVYAMRFLTTHGWHSFIVLGAVVLCITGGEALYADMGHFGRPSIRFAWLVFVWPSLLLNYFGQGARLLDLPSQLPEGYRLFYDLAPSTPWLFIPLVCLATTATIIASQALISGAFSLTQQGIALGVFPRLKIVHTNSKVEGQIYMPFVNAALLTGCIVLVLLFKSSTNLAAAYGIAVTGTMAITTAGFFVVARYNWKKSLATYGLICAGLILIDLTFFSANLLKMFEGGYVPLLIAISLFYLMYVWQWGRTRLAEAYNRQTKTTVESLLKIKDHVSRIQRTAVIMASRPITSGNEKVPPLLEHFISAYGALPFHIVFVSVVSRNAPFVNERYVIHEFKNDEFGTIMSVEIHYGFMEVPNIRRDLENLKSDGRIAAHDDPGDWIILVGQENIIADAALLGSRILAAVYQRLSRNATPAHHYFGLEADKRVFTHTVNIPINGGKAKH